MTQGNPEKKVCEEGLEAARELDPQDMQTVSEAEHELE